MAQALELNVLLKLMEASENQASQNPVDHQSSSPQSKKRKRDFGYSAFDSDPVRQIKKIRKIEKKFEADTKRAKIQQQREERENKARLQDLDSEDGRERLTGKKLPIWKKRTTGPFTRSDHFSSFLYIFSCFLLFLRANDTVE